MKGLSVHYGPGLYRVAKGLVFVAFERLMIQRHSLRGVFLSSGTHLGRRSGMAPDRGSKVQTVASIVCNGLEALGSVSNGTQLYH